MTASEELNMNEEMRELNELLSKMDSTTLLLVKANAELITKNKELHEQKDELAKAAATKISRENQQATG